MKELFEQAVQIVIEAQMIADSLAEYNPGLFKNKTPLDIIQYDVASLVKELKDLYKKIGGKIKDDTH